MPGLYFDTAYVGKCYLNEPDSASVRELARSGDFVVTSSLCIAELACALRRNVRDGQLTSKIAGVLADQFAEDVQNQSWTLVPITDRILWRVDALVRTLPKSAPLRAGDAIHLVSAIEAGFDEIWTNDRHLLAAAKHAGVKGRSIE